MDDSDTKVSKEAYILENKSQDNGHQQNELNLFDNHEEEKEEKDEIKELSHSLSMVPIYDVNSPAARALGSEITKQHSGYALTYGMMLGIRFALSLQHSGVVKVGNHQLLPLEFLLKENFSFPPEGSTNPLCPTPSHGLNHTVKFKNYAPKIFHKLRETFKIDEVDYIMSLCGDFNYIEFIPNSKSGQFFFYSHNGQYIIKTVTKAESKFLFSILPQYYEFLRKNKDTLLTKFFGMYRVKLKYTSTKTYFIVMKSVFSTNKVIHSSFDIKGASIGRCVTDEEKKSVNCVYKDLDFIGMNKKLYLGSLRGKFLEQIRADVNFLSILSIMDYSLLLGIHETSAPKQRLGKKTRSTRLTVSQMSEIDQLSPSIDRSYSSIFNTYHGGCESQGQTQEIYFFGIIDILQQYNAKKRMETLIKSFRFEKKRLSSVNSQFLSLPLLFSIIFDLIKPSSTL